MPRAKEKASSGLSIELEGDRKFYTPGSSISGNVNLTTAQDFAIGSVNLECYGRVKVLFVQSHGQGESNWRGRAPLFTHSQLLYEGYHTHKPGSFSWPFVVEIPKHPDVAEVRQAKHQWKEREHFLSTEDFVPGHSMPSTFRFRKWGFGYRYHAFVEYVVQVTVKEAAGTNMVLPPSSRKATLPILVRDVAGSETKTHFLPLDVDFSLPNGLTEKTRLNSSPTASIKIQHRASTHTIKSSKLHGWDRSNVLASQAQASFSSNSIRERAKSLFDSKSLPRYSFNFTVSTPEAVPLLNENGLRFIVNAEPVRCDKLTTIPPEHYPDIRIDNISISATATTFIRFKSWVSDRHVNNTYDINLIERMPVNHVVDMSKDRKHKVAFADIGDDVEADAAAQEDGVDLLKLPGLATTLSAAKMGLQTERPLSQTFSTYVIAREYALNWTLELDVAGEKVQIQEHKVPVRVAPPEEQAMEALMREADAKKAELNAEEVNDTGSQDGEELNTDITKNVLKRLRSKKTKRQEAEEVAESSRQTNEPLQYQQGEVLPQYEQATNGIGFRNEIDEQPPSLDSTKWELFIQNMVRRWMRSPVAIA